MTQQQADELAGQLAAVGDHARGLAQEFSSRELGEPPSPGAWSAVDNLMHLTLASQAFIPRMTRTLAKLAEAGRRSDRPSRRDLVGRLYSWALEPPILFKARAPRPFVPPAGTGVDQALPAFLAEQERIVALVQQSIGLDLAARKVPTPVSRYLRFNVCSAFHAVAAHERRHLWQARRAALAAREKLTGSTGDRH